MGDKSHLEGFPCHWELTTLGEVCRRGGGSIQTGPFGSQLHSADYVKIGIPSVMPTNIGENRIIEDGIARVTEADANRLFRHRLKAGDIVYSRRGDVEKRALIREREEGWLCGTGCLKVRLGDGVVDPLFASLFLGHPSIKEWIVRNAVGATMPNLNTTIMSEVPFALPPRAEQEAIAALLGALDDKIELNQRLNEELEGMAKLLYDYWFVQYDFPMSAAQAAALGKPALTGHPYRASGGPLTYHSNLKREIPVGWEAGVADDLFVFNPSTSLRDGIVAGYFDMDAVPTRGFMTKQVQRKAFSGGTKFVNGDVVVARITPCLENGKTALITQLEDAEVGFGSTEFIVLRGRSMPLSAFGACLARSESFRKFAILNMTGTSGRKRIEASVLKTFPLSVPPSELLADFEKVCSPMFRQMNANQQQTQELTALRDWLLPMLMNGQVTVGGSKRK